MLTIKMRTDSDEATVHAIERGATNPFSTGSLGYNASGKVVIDGKRYQVSCNLIEVDSATDETRLVALENAERKAARKAGK